MNHDYCILQNGTKHLRAENLYKKLMAQQMNKLLLIICAQKIIN